MVRFWGLRELRGEVVIIVGFRVYFEGFSFVIFIFLKYGVFGLDGRYCFGLKKVVF